MNQTIEIDCAPITPRPDAYIAGVMRNSEVEYDGRAPVRKFFGEWTWDFNDIPADKWKAAQPFFKERLTALYNDGYIRYASW